MKKISILAVAALAMFSCSKNVNVNPNPVDDQISFQPTISGVVKGSYTAFDDATNKVVPIDGDKFGVYMVSDGTTTANNVEFTYQGGLFTGGYTSTEGQKLTWVELIAGTPSNVDFHSYYPYSASNTSYSNITVTIPTTQTMGVKNADGEYTTQRTVTASDFIFSKNLADAGSDKTIGFAQADVPADRTVRFTYEHALAIVEFNILNSSAITDNSWFESLSMSGNKVYTAATIDISEENPAVSPSTTGTLTIAPATKYLTTDKLVSETNSAASTCIYQMLVMPTEIEALDDAELTLSVRRGSNNTASSSSNTDKSYKNAFPVNTKWEAGKRYKYNIVVSENTIRVDLVIIEDWVEEDGGTLPVPPAA